ncbi:MULTISPECIES: L-rhamnose mutarotase [unclassified Saccharicrinis]|uniref:L-rhamnose mutarotase n=1 Tax=unclassified Saccharicrinis TaxID=2646859 RepID=UPI003D333E44
MRETEHIVINSTKSRKRICLTCDLKDNPELIEKYKYYHKPENNWPEINQGIYDAGIELMDIYLVDNRMFMICEIDATTDFDECWKKMGTYPRQSEWGELMSNFQQAIPGHKLEWVKMERVYFLKG